MEHLTPPGSVVKDGFGNRFVYLGQKDRIVVLQELFGAKREIRRHVLEAQSLIVTGEKVKVQVAKEGNSSSIEDRHGEGQRELEM